MENHYYTYMYIDPRTNVPIYVGKGFGSRWRGHLKKTHNKRFQVRIDEIRATGLEPLVVKSIEGVTNEEAIAEEIRLIAIWKRQGLDEGGVLMNFTLGGEGAAGRVLSSESQERISSAHRGKPKSPETNRLISESLKKTQSTPEAKRRLSLAKLGKPCPEITKRKLSALLSVTRRGSSNPAAKSWSVVAPSSEVHLTNDLVGFCRERNLSYVGLKAAYREARVVKAGRSKGWRLYAAS